MIIYGIPLPIWEAIGFGMKVAFLVAGIVVTLLFLVVDKEDNKKEG
jgi:hypothetical protein